MKDHKKLMRVFNKQKLLNRIRNNRRAQAFGISHDNISDSYDVSSPYCIIGGSGQKNKNRGYLYLIYRFRDQQEQILPSRLIGESKELEEAYAQFLKKERENKNLSDADEDSNSDVDYHEGAIPR